MLIITHNAAIAQMADRLIRFRDGVVQEERRIETPKDVAEIEW